MIKEILKTSIQFITSLLHMTKASYVEAIKIYHDYKQQRKTDMIVDIIMSRHDNQS